MSRTKQPVNPSPASSQTPELDLLDEDLDPLAELGEEGISTAPPQAREVEQRVEMAGHGKRLDQWLVALAPEFSRNHIQALIERGCVLVDQKVATQPSRKVTAGQTVWARLEPTAQSMAFVGEAMDLPIVFEDEHLMIINKPVGLVVHPAAGHWSGTLMNGLLAHHALAANLPRGGIVHRLDKDTSGLMVVGKSLMGCTALSRAIAAREVHRQYRALVWGHPPQTLRIEAPIGRDPSTRIKMGVVHSGKPAMTDVQLIASLDVPLSSGLGGTTISAVECTLHTGRTHQIRVHLSSRRWPLLADALYGGAPALGMTRQALHAARLSLAHPLSGEVLTFEAPLPQDMAPAWAQVVHNQSTSV